MRKFLLTFLLLLATTTNLPVTFAQISNDRVLTKEILQRRAVNNTNLAKPEITTKENLNQNKQFKYLSEHWLEVTGLILAVVSVIIAVTGYSRVSSKKQKHLKNFLHEIDDTFMSFKQKSKRCEAELYRLQDEIEDKLKKGKIDEAAFQLLEKRIEKYLKEVREQGGG